MTDRSNINVNSFDALSNHGISKAVVAIGVFDGVHLGHRKLLDELVQMAKREESSPVALTFHPHPRELLSPKSAPALLFPPDVKIRLLHEFGAEAVVTIPFTKEFASLSPDEFIDDCLCSSRVALKGICVGAKWRFGAGGAGNVEMLRARAAAGRFAFSSVEELEIDGELVSSTAIRRAVSAGKLSQVKEMLGRNYSLHGVIEQGRHIAGPELGHPTANLNLKGGILPPNGVYAGFAKIARARLPSAIAIGVSPTFREGVFSSPRVEVHIMGYKEDLYGKELEVELVGHVREERCFPNVESLKRQIDYDIQRAMEILKGQS